MVKISRFALLLLFVLVGEARAAEERPTIPAGEVWEGKVVGVSDGDTITLLVEKTQYRIRLAGIDAPESGQSFGAQAKKALSDRVFGKTIRVLSQGADRYRRTLGVVYIDGDCVNAELVRDGFAWHYLEYSDSKVLAKAEAEAKEDQAGVWADPFSVPPWEWRRKSAEERQAAAEQAAPAEATEPDEAQPAAPARTYWITNSSGVRHNAGCRYYKNSKGRECGPDDGRPCKICGG